MQQLNSAHCCEINQQNEGIKRVKVVKEKLVIMIIR